MVGDQQWDSGMEARPGGGQEELVGASCNWFLPGVAAASDHIPLGALGAGAGVEVIDLEGEKTVARLEGHKGRVAAVCFFPRKGISHLLVSAAADGNVRIWDANKRECVAVKKVGGECVALAISWSKKSFILAAEANALHVWEPPSTALVSSDTVDALLAHSESKGSAESVGAKGKSWTVKTHELKVRGRIVCVASAPDNENVAALGLHSGEILVIDWRSATVLQKLLGHTDTVQSLSFAPTHHYNGMSLLLSGARDGSLRVWDYNSGLLLLKANVIEGETIDSGKGKKAKKGKGKKRPPEQQARQSHFWLSSCWSAGEEGVIVASNGGGELQEWFLSVKHGTTRGKNTHGRKKTPPTATVQESIVTSNPSALPEREDQTLPTATLVRDDQAADGADTSEESNIESRDDVYVSAFADGRVRLQQRRRFGPGSGGVQHSRPIFCVTPAKGLGKEFFLSASMDRQVCVWSSATARAVWSVPGLGGHAYAIAFSPLHGSLLAVAVGDASVLLWDCETSAGGAPRVPLGFRSRLLWRGVQAKATALAWHPTREGLLAFACEDGRIGLVDVFSGRHRLFASRHRGQVYELEWRAEPTETQSAHHMLYSCAADGQILVSDERENESPSKTLQESVSHTVSHLLAGCSDFSWTADGRHLAVATGKGLVLLFSSIVGKESQETCLTLKAVIRRHNSTVLRVSWRELLIGEKVHSAIVSCCRDGSCFVHDVTSLELTADEEESEGSDSEQALPEEEEEDLARRRGDRCGGVLLEGHGGAVTQAQWSPWAKGQLLTASFDGTLQLWDTEGRSGLVSCRGHGGRVLDCAFSPLSPHYVVSASDDQSVRVWDLRKQSFKTPPPKTQGGKKRKRGKRRGNGNDSSGAGHHEDGKKAEKAVTGGVERSKAKTTEVFGEETDAASALVIEELMSSATEQSVTLGSALCCGGMEALEESLRDKSESLAAQGTREGCERAAELSIWQGCAASAFEMLTSGEEGGSGALEDRWLSLAPLAGYELYLKLLKLKATEEEARKRPRRAALFFLAANEPLAAVEALEKGGRPSEALTVSRLRLEPDRDRDIRLLKAWSAQLMEKGRVTEAARALVAAGEVSPAVRLLSEAAEERSNPHLLRAAAVIAKREKLMDDWQRMNNSLPLLQISCGDTGGAVTTVAQQESLRAQSFLPLIAMVRTLTLSGVLCHQEGNREPEKEEEFCVAVPTRAAALTLTAAAETAVTALPSITATLGSPSLLQTFLGILIDITQEEQKERQRLVKSDTSIKEKESVESAHDSNVSVVAMSLCNSAESLADSMAEFGAECARAAAAAQGTQRQRWQSTAAAAEAAGVALLFLSPSGEDGRPLQWRTALKAIGALLKGPRSGEEAARRLLPLWHEKEEREWKRETTVALARAHVEEGQQSLAASAFIAFAAVLRLRYIARERKGTKNPLKSDSVTGNMDDKSVIVGDESKIECEERKVSEVGSWSAVVFHSAWTEEERATAAAAEAVETLERAHARARAAQTALSALSAARARGISSEAAALEAAATAAAADAALCESVAADAKEERERAMAVSCPHPSTASAVAAVAGAADVTEEYVRRVRDETGTVAAGELE